MSSEYKIVKGIRKINSRSRSAKLRIGELI